MATITKQIPALTKVYSTLAACCRFQHTLPGGAQPVFDATMAPVGFARLPEKIDGVYVTWTAPYVAASVAAHRARVARVRAALRARYAKHRIVGPMDDEVHVYGPMPNASRLDGWWLMGSLSHAEDWLGIER